MQENKDTKRNKRNKAHSHSTNQRYKQARKTRNAHHGTSHMKSGQTQRRQKARKKNVLRAIHK